MKFFILSITLILCVNAASILDDENYEWRAFKQEYGKNYENKIEDEFRKKIFMETKREIKEHNEKYEKGLVSYRMALNQFSDLPHLEFEEMNGLVENVNDEESFSSEEIFIGVSDRPLPETVDWREYDAVTKVKSQGHCGSCWSFSATGSLEGQYFLKSGKLIELSEQNLIDCSHNHGCHGGSIIRAFNYIKANGGIDTEKSYPYEGKDDVCRFNSSYVGATVKGYVRLPLLGDEQKLKEAVATVGPISVGIHSTPNLKHYKDGVFYDAYCNTGVLNHAVLVVGYGTDMYGLDYWLVKNSWGEKWGDKGYIKMARNKENNCGIATKATYPLV